MQKRTNESPFFVLYSEGVFSFGLKARQDKQKSNPADIRSTKEVGPLKKNSVPAVHCEYAKADQKLPQLLEESFRLYLARILAAPRPDAVSCRR